MTAIFQPLYIMVELSCIKTPLTPKTTATTKKYNFNTHHQERGPLCFSQSKLSTNVSNEHTLNNAEGV